MTAAETHLAPARDWRDELVDLHVLAANGDQAAASRAEELKAADPEFRKAWAEVAARCDQVRTSATDAG
jgi:hypothetical protein